MLSRIGAILLNQASVYRVDDVAFFLSTTLDIARSATFFALVGTRGLKTPA
jgi:hypothetical protein